MAYIRTRQRAGGPQYSVCWRDPDGKQTSLTFPSQREAENCRRMVEANGGSLTATLGALESLAKNVPTLTDMLKIHIDGQPSITERSRADYRRDAKRHIEPYLGWRPVDQITEAHVNEWLKTLAATELADKTIANIHGLLSSTMNTAKRAKYRLDNPSEGKKLPRRREHLKEESVYLTPAEWAVLDKEIGNRLDGHYQLMFRTIMATGMRWGEAVALPVSALHFEPSAVVIHITRASRRDEESRAYIGPTKTKMSRRLIRVDSQVADELRAHVATKDWDDLVFRSRTGAAVSHSNVRSRVWVPAVTAAQDRAKHGAAALRGAPRIHDLRHSYASWLIAGGTDLMTVQRNLGHESIVTTTAVYGHLMQAPQKAAAEAIGRAMAW